MDNDFILNKFANLDTDDEYLSYTFDANGEYLTILLNEQDKTVVGVFTHIQAHDRFYCDSLYGDYDTNVEFAERIDRIMMEEAEKDNLKGDR